MVCISIERVYNHQPTVTFWQDVKAGKEAAEITFNGRESWRVAYRIARSLRRLGWCRVFANNRVEKIIVGGDQCHMIEVKEMA